MSENEIRDEKLAVALLYSFTKGYGNVPMDVYRIVLPLLFNNTFRNALSSKKPLKDCINMCVTEQQDFKKVILQQMRDLEDTTTRALGKALLNKHIDFNFVDGIMHGQDNTSTTISLYEATLLGEYIKGYTLDEIIEVLGQGGETIVFLDADTLGKDMDISCLSDFGKVIILSNVAQEEIPKHIQEATIIITNDKILGKEELKNAKKVKLICVTATGFNTIDTSFCKKHDITVCNVRGYSTNSVAQHTFALLLDLYQKNHYYHEYVTSGQYSANTMFTHFEETFYELEGKTWGIVGMGDIGQKVAEIAKVFGCVVQYFSTSGKNTAQPYACVDFHTLLRTSDIISIHAPLNEQTVNLFNKEAFQLMKPSAYLINVGRGKIINELDLVLALKNKVIAGAGLDVFENEPFSRTHPLLSIDANVVRLTPHIAWATKEARKRVIKQLHLNIEAFLAGKPRNVC